MNHDRLFELIDGKLEDRLSDSDRIELSLMLRESARARLVYWEFVQQDALLQEVVQESTGRDLARITLGEFDAGQVMLSKDSSRHARALVGTRGWMVGSFVTAVVLVVAIVIYFRSLRPVGNPIPRESVASIQTLTGDVWKVAPDSSAVKATSSQQFLKGEALQVGEDGAAEVMLTDGSRIVLSADSLLRFASSNVSQNGLHLENGGAEVEAAPQSPDRPLIITTGQARLTVLGTRFRLYAAGADSRVELEEGKVRFERQSDGEAVEVDAGQYAIATMGSDSPQPLVAQPLHAEWRLRQTLLRAGSRIVFSHDGTRLATAGFPRLKVWNIVTGELQHELKAGVRLECLAFTPSDEEIVGLNDHGHAVFWSIGKSDARQTDLKAEGATLRRSAVTRDGRWLAQTTSADSGHLPVWRVDDAGTISQLRSLPMKAGGVAISATATGPQVVSSVWHGTTVKWEAESGRELVRYEFRSQLHVVELSTDGRWLGGYGNKTGLLLVDTATGEQRNLWPADSVRVNAVCFSRDGQVLFAGMADGVVRAWSTPEGRQLFVLATGDSRLTSLDVSDDGHWLAVSGDAERVTIWQSDPR